MQNGLYRVEFRTPLGSGAGVVVLQDDNLRGGDSSSHPEHPDKERGAKGLPAIIPRHCQPRPNSPCSTSSSGRAVRT